MSIWNDVNLNEDSLSQSDDFHDTLEETKEFFYKRLVSITILLTECLLVNPNDTIKKLYEHESTSSDMIQHIRSLQKEKKTTKAKDTNYRHRISPEDVAFIRILLELLQPLLSSSIQFRRILTEFNNHRNDIQTMSTPVHFYLLNMLFPPIPKNSQNPNIHPEILSSFLSLIASFKFNIAIIMESHHWKSLIQNIYTCTSKYDVSSKPKINTPHQESRNGIDVDTDAEPAITSNITEVQYPVLVVKCMEMILLSNKIKDQFICHKRTESTTSSWECLFLHLYYGAALHCPKEYYGEISDPIDCLPCKCGVFFSTKNMLRCAFSCLSIDSVNYLLLSIQRQMALLCIKEGVDGNDNNEKQTSLAGQKGDKGPDFSSNNKVLPRWVYIDLLFLIYQARNSSVAVSIANNPQMLQTLVKFSLVNENNGSKMISDHDSDNMTDSSSEEEKVGRAREFLEQISCTKKNRLFERFVDFNQDLSSNNNFDNCNADSSTVTKQHLLNTSLGIYSVIHDTLAFSHNKDALGVTSEIWIEIAWQVLFSHSEAKIHPNHPSGSDTNYTNTLLFALIVLVCVFHEIPRRRQSIIQTTIDALKSTHNEKLQMLLCTFVQSCTLSIGNQDKTSTSIDTTVTNKDENTVFDPVIELLFSTSILSEESSLSIKLWRELLKTVLSIPKMRTRVLQMCRTTFCYAFAQSQCDNSVHTDIDSENLVANESNYQVSCEALCILISTSGSVESESQEDAFFLVCEILISRNNSATGNQISTPLFVYINLLRKLTEIVSSSTLSIDSCKKLSHIVVSLLLDFCFVIDDSMVENDYISLSEVSSKEEMQQFIRYLVKTLVFDPSFNCFIKFDNSNNENISRKRNKMMELGESDFFSTFDLASCERDTRNCYIFRQDVLLLIKLFIALYQKVVFYSSTTEEGHTITADGIGLTMYQDFIIKILLDQHSIENGIQRDSIDLQVRSMTSIISSSGKNENDILAVILSVCMMKITSYSIRCKDDDEVHKHQNDLYKKLLTKRREFIHSNRNKSSSEISALYPLIAELRRYLHDQYCHKSSSKTHPQLSCLHPENHISFNASSILGTSSCLDEIATLMELYKSTKDQLFLTDVILDALLQPSVVSISMQMSPQHVSYNQLCQAVLLLFQKNFSERFNSYESVSVRNVSLRNAHLAYTCLCIISNTSFDFDDSDNKSIETGDHYLSTPKSSLSSPGILLDQNFIRLTLHLCSILSGAFSCRNIATYDLFGIPIHTSEIEREYNHNFTQRTQSHHSCKESLEHVIHLILNLYKKFSSEEKAFDIVLHMVKNEIFDSEDEDEDSPNNSERNSTQRNNENCIMNSIYTWIRKLRYGILTVFCESMTHFVEKLNPPDSEKAIEAFISQQLLFSDRIGTVRVLTETISKLSIDLRKGLEGHSGAITYELYIKFTNCIEQSVALFSLLINQYCKSMTDKSMKNLHFHQVSISLQEASLNLWTILCENSFSFGPKKQKYEKELFERTLELAIKSLPLLRSKISRRLGITDHEVFHEDTSIMNKVEHQEQSINKRFLVVETSNQCLDMLREWYIHKCSKGANEKNDDDVKSKESDHITIWEKVSKVFNEDKSLLNLNSAEIWSSAFDSALSSMNFLSWQESYRIISSVKKSSSKANSCSEEPFILSEKFLTCYCFQRQKELCAILRNIGSILGQVDPVEGKNEELDLTQYAELLSDQTKIMLCNLLYKIIDTLNMSVGTLSKSLKEKIPSKKFSVAVLESIVCLASFLNATSSPSTSKNENSDNIASGTRLWYTIEKKRYSLIRKELKESNQFCYEQQKALLSKLNQLNIRVEKFEVSLQNLLDRAIGILDNNTEDNCQLEEYNILLAFVLGIDIEEYDENDSGLLIKLLKECLMTCSATEKYSAKKRNVENTLSTSSFSLLSDQHRMTLIVDMQGFWKDSGQRDKKQASEGHQKTEQSRKRKRSIKLDYSRNRQLEKNSTKKGKDDVIIRSRNKAIDTFLAMDRDLVEKHKNDNDISEEYRGSGDLNDGYVDLEDFLEEG